MTDRRAITAGAPGIEYRAAGFRLALRTQRRVLAANITRDIHFLLEGGAHRLLMGIAEPILAIGVALTWHTLMQVTAPYGTNRALFLTTGFFPTYLFIHMSSGFRLSAKKNTGRHRFPTERQLDAVFSASMLNVVIYAYAGVLGFTLLYFFETPNSLPSNWIWIMQSFFGMCLLGFGTGLCNTFIEEFFPAWRSLWIGFSRALILFSGIFYVPSFLPVYVREIMSWNPVLQGVEYFRYGIYPGYPQNCNFPIYFWSFAATLVVVGLCLRMAFERELERA